MDLKFVPVSIAVRSSVEGQLVFTGDNLLAVLVLLGNLHEDNAGKWFLEIAFHEKIINNGRIFESISEAEIWIRECLTSKRRRDDSIRSREPNWT